jgi:hypothetical protein
MICTILVQISAIVLFVLTSMIFTIAAIVRISIWQPNRFVHDLAPFFVILVVRSSFSSQLLPVATDGNHQNQTGQVDIRDLSLENIEAVRQEHFRHRDIEIFAKTSRTSLLRSTSRPNIEARDATEAEKVSCGVWY